MSSIKKTEVGASMGLDKIEAKIAQELFQDTITLKNRDFKIIPHIDGKGETWVFRSDDTITAMTRRYEKDGIMKNGLHSVVESFVIRKGEVIFNGRKL